MIIPDLNLLLYAYNPSATRYSAARQWWEGLVNGTEPVGIPWVVIVGFVRLATQGRAIQPPVPLNEAIDTVEEWFRYSHITPIDPGAAHLDHFRNALTSTVVSPRLVTDAHIAALAIENGAEIHTNDSDFNRFPGIRRHNPL